MDAMTKEPQASKATVERLRLRRRAQPRIARPASVKPAPSARRASARSQAATAPRPAINNSEPALKKYSAFDRSPLIKAQTMIPSALRPAPRAIHMPRLRDCDFVIPAWDSSPVRSSRAGFRACLRKVIQIVRMATTRLANVPMIREVALAWNCREELATALFQRVVKAQIMALA